jgi:hypothetical protein
VTKRDFGAAIGGLARPASVADAMASREMKWERSMAAANLHVLPGKQISAIHFGAIQPLEAD